MPRGPQVGVGRNIALGLFFFVIFAGACGIGGFIGIVLSNESTLFIVLLVSIMIIGVGPIIAMVIGIMQGKLAMNGRDAMVAGAVTGIVGYVVLIIIILGFLAAAVAIRYPSDGDGTDGDVEVDINLKEMAGQLIATFLPSGIIGGFSAFFSKKYIFAPEYPIPSPEWGVQYGQRRPQQRQESPHPSQRSRYTPQYVEPDVGTYVCPHCQNSFTAQTEGRTVSGNCPTCGGYITIGP